MKVQTVLSQYQKCFSFQKYVRHFKLALRIIFNVITKISLIDKLNF